jgi:hypothetical protein
MDSVLVDRVFDLLPVLRQAAAAAWREWPQLGRWQLASEDFVRYDAALRVAARLARELPDVSVFPCRTGAAVDGAYDSTVQVGEVGSGVTIVVRGRLLDGFIDLEVKRR